MRRVIFTLILLNSFLFSDLLVVTNKNTKIENLSKDIIQYLYLEKISKVGGIKVIPLTNKDEKKHEKFVTKVLNKSISQYNSYWARLVFTGRKSIPKKLNDNQILKKLDSVNTIAYIKRSDLKKNMKILYEEKVD